MALPSDIKARYDHFSKEQLISAVLELESELCERRSSVRMCETCGDVEECNWCFSCGRTECVGEKNPTLKKCRKCDSYFCKIHLRCEGCHTSGV